jgi:uncharacterized protein (DUF1501 family)
MNTDETITIHVVVDTLTDGSKVYNVRFGGVTLHATDETAANRLAESLVEAINELTVDDARLVAA